MDEHGFKPDVPDDGVGGTLIDNPSFIFRGDVPLEADEEAAPYIVDGEELAFDALASNLVNEMFNLISQPRSSHPGGTRLRPIAICSAWGTGKTSLLTRIERIIGSSDDDLSQSLPKREARQKPVVVSFNPWMFSSREDLCTQFFKQLHDALASRGDKGKEAAKELLKYGLMAINGVVKIANSAYNASASQNDQTDVDDSSSKAKSYFDWFKRWIPFQRKVDPVKAGLVAAESLSSVALQQMSKEKSLAATKVEVCRMLAKEEIPPVIVLIDDIDRMPDEDIRQFFRFINCVVDFPNVLYVMAFDRSVVEAALSGLQSEDSSESFLDKIVSFRVDLPDLSLVAFAKHCLVQFEDLAWLQEGGDDVVGSLAVYLGSARAVKKLIINYHGLTVVRSRQPLGDGAWDRLISVCARDTLPRFYKTLQSLSHNMLTEIIDGVRRYPELCQSDGDADDDPERASNKVVGQEFKSNMAEELDDESGVSRLADRNTTTGVVELFLGAINGGGSPSSEMVCHFDLKLRELDCGRFTDLDRGYRQGDCSYGLSCWHLLWIYVCGLRTIENATAESPAGVDGGASNERGEAGRDATSNSLFTVFTRSPSVNNFDDASSKHVPRAVIFKPEAFTTSSQDYLSRWMKEASKSKKTDQEAEE